MVIIPWEDIGQDEISGGVLQVETDLGQTVDGTIQTIHD